MYKKISVFMMCLAVLGVGFNVAGMAMREFDALFVLNFVCGLVCVGLFAFWLRVFRHGF